MTTVILDTPSQTKSMVEDTLLEINEELLTMFTMTIKSFENSNLALNEGNNKLAMKVISKDDDINHLEETINYKVTVALAKYQPMASDLRKLIAAIKISNDVERIADYAKNIAKTAIVNTDKTFLTDTFLEKADEMSKIVVKMLKKSEETLKDYDVNKAYKVANLGDDLDQILKEAIKSNPFQLINEKNAESYIEIMGILRSLERARDHVKNVCESIIFVGNGTFVEL
jgi:phosphate transport system protein